MAELTTQFWGVECYSIFMEINATLHDRFLMESLPELQC